jgi:hypothetical protein
MFEKVSLDNIISWQETPKEELVRIVRELSNERLSRRKIADRIPGATIGMVSRLCKTYKIKSKIPPCVAKEASTKRIAKVAKIKIHKKRPPVKKRRTGFNYSGPYNAMVREIISLRKRGATPGLIMERFGINEDQLRGMCKREDIDPGFPKVKKKQVVPLPEDWKFHGRSITTKCQWDVSENSRVIDFCGRETFGGSPYCHGHASLAYPKRK